MSCSDERSCDIIKNPNIDNFYVLLLKTGEEVSHYCMCHNLTKAENISHNWVDLGIDPMSETGDINGNDTEDSEG